MSRRARGRRQAQPEAGTTDLIWGLKPVAEALRHQPDRLSEIMVQRGKAGPRYQEIIDLARRHSLKLRFVEMDRLGFPARSPHQGVAARQAAVRFVPFVELLEQTLADSETPFPRLLLLDSIQDPHNLGAVLRSALAAGFSSVVLPRDRSAPLAGTVVKTSAGAVARLRISQVVNLAEALKTIRQSGFWIFGAVADSEALSLYEADFDLPLCLVVGSEGKGIRPLVLKQCDHLLTIPMRNDFDSLNVSVAAAIIMFEINRRRLHG